MWYAILISFGIVLILFLRTNPAAFHTKINTFAGAVDGVKNFCGQAEPAALAAGADFHPPFLLFGTLMVAPSPGRASSGRPTRSSRAARSRTRNVFRNQVFILVGSFAATAGLLVLLAIAMNTGSVATASAWLHRGTGT